jgi:hypothetical protein
MRREPPGMPYPKLQQIHLCVPVKGDAPHPRVELHLIPDAHQPRFLDFTPFLLGDEPLGSVKLVILPHPGSLGLDTGLHQSRPARAGTRELKIDGEGMKPPARPKLPQALCG